VAPLQEDFVRTECIDPLMLPAAGAAHPGTASAAIAC
jgi:hypothetical protein